HQPHSLTTYAPGTKPAASPAAANPPTGATSTTASLTPTAQPAHPTSVAYAATITDSSTSATGQWNTHPMASLPGPHQPNGNTSPGPETDSKRLRLTESSGNSDRVARSYLNSIRPCWRGSAGPVTAMTEVSNSVRVTWS